MVPGLEAVIGRPRITERRPGNMAAKKKGTKKKATKKKAAKK